MAVHLERQSGEKTSQLAARKIPLEPISSVGANTNDSAQQSRQQRSHWHHRVRKNVHAGVDAAQQVRGDQFLTQADLVDRGDGKPGVTAELGQGHQREDQGERSDSERCAEGERAKEQGRANQRFPRTEMARTRARTERARERTNSPKCDKNTEGEDILVKRPSCVEPRKLQQRNGVSRWNQP